MGVSLNSSSTPWTFGPTNQVDLGDETRLFGRLSGPGGSPCRHCKCRLSENSPSVKSEISQTSWSKGLAEPLLQVGSMILMIFDGFLWSSSPPHKKQGGWGGSYFLVHTKNGEMKMIGRVKVIFDQNHENFPETSIKHGIGNVQKTHGKFERYPDDDFGSWNPWNPSNFSSLTGVKQGQYH